MVLEFAPRPGRLALFLEGGYNPVSLESSVEATLGALLGLPVHPPSPTHGGPGLSQLRADHTDWLHAVDRVHMEVGP